MSVIRSVLAALLLGLAAAASAQPIAPPAGERLVTAPPDPRERIRFTADLRRQTLATMRDYLTALQQIHEALARADYGRAAEVADSRLGTASPQPAEGADAGRFMPLGMRQIYADMHQAASRFAAQARGLPAGADIRPAVGELGHVMKQCVACHSAYRVQ